MRYDLQRLGAIGFQDVAAALAIAHFGPIVKRLGRGRDGGRDMEAKGSLVWRAGSGDEHGEVWEGHTIFQVKHHERPTTPKEDAAWLWREIRKELVAWADPDTKRGRVPDFLVFVTNVRLSPDPRSGGLAYVEGKVRDFLSGLADDQFDTADSGAERRLRQARMKPLKKWAFWDGDQIDGLIDANGDVRRAFDGFLTPGDVLAVVTALSGVLPEGDIGPALEEHSRSVLVGQRNIYFDEAGGDGPGVAVDRIAVDLPVRVRESGERARAIRYILDRGDHVLRPSFVTLDKPRHIVLVGAPGNGKSTISKFLVQAYRAALVASGDARSDDINSAVEGTAAALARLKRGLPAHRRWPVRVDLAEFAKQYVTLDHKTLTSWIAAKVSSESNTPMLKPWILKEWMKAWPWFVILDGLDEVSEPAVRQWIISTIQTFVSDAEAADADVLVAVTTRPTGYLEEMPPEQFEELDLDALSTAEAVAYGHMVTQVRLRKDVDRIAKVDALLREAAGNDALKHLLRTPLQVQIMTIIAEGAGSFAPDRYSLFWRYYEIVEQRERRKGTPLARLLQEHSDQIRALHERVGLELQKRSEAALDATATLPLKDLEDLAWRVLHDDEYDPSGQHADLLTRIVQIATHRLVLLAPRDDGFGFDVRSLQELMAARRLTTGTLDHVLARLRVLAPSAHWRNTWLFAAGRYFASPQEHEHEGIVNLVLSVDEGAADRFASTSPAGPYLAWDILDDGMTNSRPRWFNRLLDHGLSLLDYPAPQDVYAVVQQLVQLATRYPDARTMIRDHIRASLAGDVSSRQNAAALQEELKLLGDAVADPDVRLLAGVKKDPSNGLPAEAPTAWAEFDAAIEIYPSDDVRDVVAKAAELLRKATTQQMTAMELLDLYDAGTEPEIVQVVEEAVNHIARTEPNVVAVLFDTMVRAALRRPVAHLLGDLP